MSVTYSRHALEAMVERDLDPAWVARTIASPENLEPDPNHTERTRAFRVVPERDGRVLRVVYVRTGANDHVVTVFLDRGRKRQR